MTEDEDEDIKVFDEFKENKITRKDLENIM